MSHRNQISDIEALRAIAVSFVVVHHSLSDLFVWSAPWKARADAYFAGWIGVDLFFVISGFVIVRGLLPRLHQCGARGEENHEIIRFWVKRAWRLLPSAWLWLLVALILSVSFNQTGVFGTLIDNLATTVASILSIMNFRMADGLFSYPVGTSFVHWSLSLETQFYLIVPFLIIVLRKNLVYLLIAVVALQFFVDRSLLLMFVRTDALAIGALLGIFSAKSTYFSAEPKGLAKSSVLQYAVVGFLVFSLAIIGSEHLKITPYPVGVGAVLSGALVWLASYDKNYIFPKGVVKEVLVWVGTRSYAIYLIHIPAFFVTRELWFRLMPEGYPIDGSLTAEYLVTAGILILVAAELNYRFVEYPLRHRGRQIAQSMDAHRGREENTPSPGISSPNASARTGASPGV